MLYRFYRCSEWLASWLPPRIAYALARIVGFGLFLCSRDLRRTLVANQRRAASGASRQRVRRNARRAAIAVAKNYYDLFRLPSMTCEDLLGYFDSYGVEHIREAYMRGKGVIIFAPHMGSYSLVPSYVSCLGFEAVTVIEHIRDPQLHDYFFRLRANSGVELLTTGPQDVRRILRALREGKIVIMLADRSVGTSSDEVEFFGERTLLPAGPALLARRTGAALIPAFSYRTGNTRSVAIGLPVMALPDVAGTPEQRRAADTQAVARKLEAMIAQAPDEWAVLQPVWPRRRVIPRPDLNEAAG